MPDADDLPPSDRDVESIYRVHAALVGRWVKHLAGPRLNVDAEDLVHEIFLIVQRQLPAFRGDAKLTTWLYRITQNVVSTARRKERARRWMRLLRRVELQQSLASSPSVPGDDLEQQQEVRTLYRALDTLPDKYRSPLILFELEAMTGEQIASVTGLPPQTVRVRIHRARKLFGKALARLGVTPNGR
jgi:RNA polymerase sigma-70 factor (ECF subfamily)